MDGMKEPRFSLAIEGLTINSLLSLRDNNSLPKDAKRQIERQIDAYWQDWKAWRKKNFKCAAGIS